MSGRISNFIVGISAFLSVLSIEARAVTADQFDYSNYFRSGIGRNNKGGDQSCFTNPLASDHNDFRLGNECGAYSELSLRAIPVKGKPDEPFFAAETMFSFAPPNEGNGEPPNFLIREIFIEGGNLFGKGYRYWIGKRYYRDIDAHMDDFFYYGGITGNGAGITNIDTGHGRLAIALFLNSLSDATPANGSTPATTPSLSSDIGVPQGRYLDIRLSDLPLSAKDHLHFWLGAADQKSTPITSGTLTGQTLGNFFGALAGTRYRRETKNLTNDLAVIYGYGLLSRFNTENVIGFTNGNPIGKAEGLRTLDHATLQYAHWAMHAIATLELRRNYYAGNQGGWYFSAGIRPVYFITNNFHLAFELGHNESQDGGYGVGQTLKVTRFTVAPEIVAAKSIWSRPALRLFYSASFWNAGSRGVIGGPGYANDTMGTDWGLQGEIWF